MRSVNKLFCIVFVAALVFGGCATPSKNETASVKNVPNTSQQPGGGVSSPAVAMVMDIQKQSLPDKPEVTRVVLALDKKVSYSTSREGNQLIINVFSAKMKSSLAQLDIQDPVIKTITTKQVGNSVKSVIELASQEVAYRPSTSPDPFQIVIDVWRVSSQTALGQPASQQRTAAITPSSGAAPATTPSSGTEEPRTKEVTLSTQIKPVTESNSVVPPTSDIPSQLQWFSEKLSQVLQEREQLKQQLLESEKSFAVKDSMIQVLERKVKEANTRVVELEEELIKLKSKSSLAEENEKALQDQLSQMIGRLEQAAGLQGGTPTVSTPDELRTRTEQLVEKVAALAQESVVLGETQTEIDSLKTQIASLTQERDDLQARLNSFAAQVETMKETTAKLSVIERELGVKESELSRLRQAIGAAAQLVTGTSASLATRNVQPEIQSAQVAVPPSTSPAASASGTESTPPQTNTQVEIAQLLQQQQFLPPDEEEYILGPDDVISIKVLKEENLDKTVTVSTDGFITYPLLGDLRVEGLTTAQVDAQMTSLLARDFLVDPEVVIEVVKQRSKKVYIMGLVKQPGYQEIAGDQRLLGTLLSAGGPASFNTEARILRLPKGSELSGNQAIDTLAPLIVDLQKLFVQGDQSQNVALRDGDVVMVAEKSASGVPGEKIAMGPNQFYVVGSVVNPGVYNYQPNDTALDAVLRAGGFTEFAARNSTKVVRDIDGKTKTFQVKMKDVMDKGDMDKNIKIMPGDMIIVPESFF